MMRWLALLPLLSPAPAFAQATVDSSCGTASYTAGTPHNVTVDTNGQSCQVGGGSGTGAGCSQATAYLARATGETAHAADLTTLICGLVADGVWAKLDALYVLAQQTKADANLNLVGTSYGLTPAAEPWVQYQGYTYVSPGFGVDTGFNMSTASSPHITRDNGSIGGWAYTPIANNLIGSGGVVGDTNIGWAAGSYFCYIAYSTGASSTTLAAPTGFSGCDRSSTTTTNFYIAGVNAFTVSATSQAPNNDDIILVGGTNAAGTISEGNFGASLGSAGQLALYNRLRTYMTSVGVP